MKSFFWWGGLSLILAEFFLRLINFPYQGCRDYAWQSEQSLAKYDALLGWDYRPNRTTKQGNITYAFNKEGYRAFNESKQTSEGKPKILLVGDSVIFGHGINFTDTLGYQLQQKLNNQYEVLNFAVQGYGLDQVLLKTQKLASHYQPKFIVMSFIDEQIARAVNEDRREFYQCSIFWGTKPVFRQKKSSYQLVRPQPYQTYDNPRLKLLFNRLSHIIAPKESINESEQLNRELIKQINKQAKAHQARLIIIAYNSQKISQLTAGLGIKLVNINNLPGNPQQYMVSKRDPHPNGKANAIIVRRLLHEFPVVGRRD